MLRSVCCICGNPVAPEFKLCEACERAYALKKPISQWPEWAKFLWMDEKKRRRRAEHTIEIIPVSELPEIERLFYGESNDDA